MLDELKMNYLTTYLSGLHLSGVRSLQCLFNMINMSIDSL